MTIYLSEISRTTLKHDEHGFGHANWLTYMTSNKGIEELLSFAEQIGLNPLHVQYDNYRYFTLTALQRKIAIEAGAIPLSNHEYGYLAQALEAGETWQHGSGNDT